ncbi:hypothetical protein KC878_01345 [Candidatus Saccharibacteria bacterium]|nr:hypothetical protein [Candidatus Saccharibacteria bacterium]MCB9821130.1 hypothetical protein [Candidatus Nomurabacteria bacterium]
MIQKIKLSLIAFVAMALPMVPAVVSAATTNTTGDSSNAACAGANLDASALDGTGGATCDASTTEDTSINNLVRSVITIFSWVVGVVSVIMIIIAGFKYVVSGGDSGGVSGAKNTIIYAIVGLVVVLLAQIIVRFVVNNVNTAG